MKLCFILSDTLMITIDIILVALGILLCVLVMNEHGFFLGVVSAGIYIVLMKTQGIESNPLKEKLNECKSLKEK